MIDRANSPAYRASTTAALMLSVFTVSMGYGIVLPLLPDVIERLLGAAVRRSKPAGNIARRELSRSEGPSGN